MMIFEYKNVFIFASAVASLFIVALNISTNQEFVEEKEFEVKKEKERIVDLPPAENVLLATGYRTGSSFLGEFFNQNDDVFYLFEPDHRFLTNEIRKNVQGMDKTVQEEWASFVLDLFQCNFTNPPLILNKKIVFVKKSQALNSLKSANLKEAEKLCKKRRRVIKTIKPAEIGILLREAEKRDVDLRILLYFRDARPVYLSRVKAHEIKGGNYFLNIDNYCQEKLRQWNYFVEHQNLESILKTVTYENVAENPKIEARNIYNFLKWELSENVLKWIEKNTQNYKGGTFGTSRNSTEKISEWKTKIGLEEKFLIDSICKSYLETFNYQ